MDITDTECIYLSRLREYPSYKKRVRLKSLEDPELKEIHKLTYDMGNRLSHVVRINMREKTLIATKWLIKISEKTKYLGTNRA